MTLRPAVTIGILLAGAIVACSSAPPFTLYRNEGVGDDTSRVHVGTFDADETEEYNRDNCERARELFQIQPTNPARYWCEPGRFSKKAKRT